MSGVAGEEDDHVPASASAGGGSTGDEKMKMEKGAAESEHQFFFKRPILSDDDLFRQPDSSHHGECQVCFLPLSLDLEKSILKSCCTKMICKGCVYANYISNIHDQVKARSCPFCRTPASDSEKETWERRMKRAKAGDPAAIREIGGNYFVKKDYPKAFEYYTKAAELGDLRAHYQLGCFYSGRCGVEKDEEKEIYHLEIAAIGGHPYARHNLAFVEDSRGNKERALKHFIIAANIGCDESMQLLEEEYNDGNITKETFDASLRGYKSAIDATKSSQREAGEIALV